MYSKALQYVHTFMTFKLYGIFSAHSWLSAVTPNVNHSYVPKQITRMLVACYENSLFC